MGSVRILIFWREAVVRYDSNKTSLSKEGAKTCMDKVEGWGLRTITSGESTSVDEEQDWKFSSKIGCVGWIVDVELKIFLEVERIREDRDIRNDASYCHIERFSWVRW